jgi:hypothetical protein
VTDKVKVHVPNPSGGGTTTYEVRRESPSASPTNAPPGSGVSSSKK